MPSNSLTRLTRRASLLALGSVGLNAASQPLAANARSKKKKGGINKRCKQQVDPCKSIVTGGCEGDAQCIATLSACCESLKTCAFSDFVTCLNAAVAAVN